MRAVRGDTRSFDYSSCGMPEEYMTALPVKP